MLRIRDNKHCN